MKGGGDLTEEINNILEGCWKPRNQDHEEVIYYVSGFVLRTVYNRSKDRKGVAHLLKQLEHNASITKEEAETAGLVGVCCPRETRCLFPINVLH